MNKEDYRSLLSIWHDNESQNKKFFGGFNRIKTYEKILGIWSRYNDIPESRNPLLAVADYISCFFSYRMLEEMELFLNKCLKELQ